MRDKHEIWTEVRVKKTAWASYIALSSQVKIEVSLHSSIFLPTVLPVIIQKQKLNAEWKKKVLWARTAVFLVTLIKRHNLSCSFCFKLKLQCMHECISIVSYVPGGVQFSKRLDFHCYQGDSFRSWETLFCLWEITSPSKNCKWRGRTQSCSSGLCTGKNLIFFRKSKPHICINSSKFLWPLSLSRHCWLVIFEYLIQ